MIEQEDMGVIAHWQQLSYDDKRKMLVGLAPELAIVRKGFHYPCRMPQLATINSSLHLRPREIIIARLFALEANVLAEDGKYARAAASGLDGLHFARDCANDTSITGSLISIICASGVREQLWQVCPRLGAAEAKVAARRLEAFSLHGVPYATVLAAREANLYGVAACLSRAPAAFSPVDG